MCKITERRNISCYTQLCKEYGSEQADVILNTIGNLICTDDSAKQTTATCRIGRRKSATWRICRWIWMWIGLAPILCAGVTVYKGLKETDTKAGEWVAISGIGYLRHLAVPMGMHVAAIDVSDGKLELAKRLEADLTVSARQGDPGAFLKKETGGMHSVLATAVSPIAFRQGISALRKKGTMALTGLPPCNFELPIFQTVLNRHAIRGSIVGTRKDMQEAVGFAMGGKVKATVRTARLGDINSIFDQMKAGRIEGRVVMTM